jgi:hypothetical protein
MRNLFFRSCLAYPYFVLSHSLKTSNSHFSSTTKDENKHKYKYQTRARSKYILRGEKVEKSRRGELSTAESRHVK